MSRIRVLLDACVLVPYQLADLLLHIADAELFEPLWSTDVLTEVQRSIIKLDIHPDKTARRGHAMVQFVERCPGDDEIAYIKFMPNATHSAVAFTAAPIEDVKIPTLVLCPDGLWRVWGIRTGRFPSPQEVRGQ